MRLDRVDYEEEIFQSDLNKVDCLQKDSFEFALCRFVCEIKKCKTDEDYPARTLYQMICAIQNHLRKNNCDWKLVHSNSEFQKFNHVLDKVMQERAANNIGTVKKQAEVISLEFENTPWTKGVLGGIAQTS